MARVMAVGMAAATSWAKEGPPRVPMGFEGAYLDMICDMRRKVFSSMPLLAESRICFDVSMGAICSMTERRAWLGVTQRRMSAPAMAWLRLAVTRTSAGMMKLGR
jgi:hypothetical protein